MRVSGSVIACGGNADNIAVHCQLQGGCHIFAIVTAQRHIDHIRVHFNGVINGKDNIRRRFEFSGLINLAFYYQELDIRCDTGSTYTIHLGSNNAGYCRTMAILVLNHTDAILLRHLVIGGIVGLETDYAVSLCVNKLRMICVNAGVDDRNGNFFIVLGFASGQVPGITNVDIVQIGLLGIHCVIDLITCPHLSIFNDFFCSAEVIIVQLDPVMILAVGIILCNFVQCNAIGQTDDRKTAIVCNSQSSAECFGDFPGFPPVGRRKYNAVFVIISRV